MAKELNQEDCDKVFSKLWCSMMFFDKAMEWLYDADDTLYELDRMRFKIKHERGKLQKILDDYFDLLNKEFRTVDTQEETKILRMQLLGDYDKFTRKVDSFLKECVEKGDIYECL